MSNSDSPCSHTHIEYDIHICLTIVTRHVVTHIKHDIP